MKTKIHIIFFLCIFLFIAVIYREWFTQKLILGNDTTFLFNTSFNERFIYPYTWSISRSGFFAPFLWSHFVEIVPTILVGRLLEPPWPILLRITLYFPFLVLSLFSSYYVGKKLFGSVHLAIISCLIYTVNTYILLIVGGGQMQIALAYSITPLVLYNFVDFISNIFFSKNINLRQFLLKNITMGLFLSLQIMFDIRIAYVSVAAITIFLVISTALKFSIRSVVYSCVGVYIIPSIIAFLIHAYWILPVLFNRTSPLVDLGSAYNSTDAVNFFSFATLENTISLLHPLWPDNIFGKTGFMQPEFLLLPVIAFSILLILKFGAYKENTKDFSILIFLFSLAIIGAFLSKGSKPPFGEVYLFLFSYIPGFSLFRDPTKFYVLIAFSYSLLIPFTLFQLYKIYKPTRFSATFNKYQLPYIGILVFFLMYSFLYRDAIMGQLTGTFKRTEIPQEYTKLASFLSDDKQYYRTLWFPSHVKFGYYSDIHPPSLAREFFNVFDDKQLLQKFESTSTAEMLRNASIRYVIVPYDINGELFIEDRRYSSLKYEYTVNSLRNVPWLKEITGFGNIKIFEVPDWKDHLWVLGSGDVKYTFINPTQFNIQISNASIGDRLIFTEFFNPNWVLIYENKVLPSVIYMNKFNSFPIPQGTYEAKVYFAPQKFTDIGLFISVCSLLFFFILALVLNKNIWKK